MNAEPKHAPATGDWKVVFLLLGSARKRAAGRRRRRQELMSRRKAGSSLDLGSLATVGAVCFMMLLHGAAAYIVVRAVKGGQRLAAERSGKIVVDRWFEKTVEASFAAPRSRVEQRNEDERMDDRCHSEAQALARQYGGKAEALEARLRAAVRRSGAGELVADTDVEKGLDALPDDHSLAALLGSVVVLWWAVMLVFQGEGLELDLQRRRHPMWEWLYAHPVSAAAIFTAEMLAPVAANPMYGAAPVFVGGLYGLVYGPLWGVIAGLAAGVPVALAAACLGKALEIGITLRFSPRSRGALLGLMSWAGYASMTLLFLTLASLSKVVAVAGGLLAPLTALPWPWLGWLLGRQGDGSCSFLGGLAACWVAAGVTAAAAVRFCVWGAQRGLSGSYGGLEAGKPQQAGAVRFGKEPLYRKEFLWFVRDRSAIVQTILIPLTVAGFQLFNLRGAISAAQGSWNALSGAAILFGTYFLWVLGPKSLASEGSALWLALTWPRGLESLLKAKAWLWTMISTGVVALVLLYAACLFPAEWWKIALLSVGWLVFGQSMAEKTVTLVSVTSSSGEPEPIPKGRRWAASLGMLTFAVGVLTRQWTVAITGIVYSHLTAAAMWESFRARLPFLYDPWSEKLPPPPTLLHAMVSISVLVEGGALVSVPFLLLAGRENFAVARSLSYGLCAFAVAFGVSRFLAGRNVPNREVWRWLDTREVAAGRTKAFWCGDGSFGARFWRALLLGVAGGAALGGAAHGYLATLKWVPGLTETIRQGQAQMDALPGLKVSYFVCAVGIAPFAEEYLFRGLLFRALDREWGGWRAVLGSAAFFAIYHPPLSWLPVGLLGAANALLFKRTGRLAPAVLLHMVYNAAVLS